MHKHSELFSETCYDVDKVDARWQPKLLIGICIWMCFQSSLILSIRCSLFNSVYDGVVRAVACLGVHSWGYWGGGHQEIRRGLTRQVARVGAAKMLGGRGAIFTKLTIVIMGAI